MRSLAAGALALLAGGCLEAKINRCDNGAICKRALECTEARAEAPQCGLPDDVAACFGMAAHTACTHAAAGGAAGSCRDNLCGDCNANWVECRYAAWTAMDSGTTSKINAVQVFAPNDVAAAADDHLHHYDGLAWSGGPPDSLFFGVWGASSSDLFAVDQSKNVYRGSTVETVAPVAQHSLWGTSADDVTSVGGGVVGHRSSAGWSFSSIGLATYFGVTGIGGTVIAVGQDSSGAAVWTVSGTTATPFSPAMPAVATNKAYGAWGTSTADFFVVGAVSNSTAFIEHFSAGTWSAMVVPTTAGQLKGIWGRAANDIYTVGDSGTILHFDGNGWTSMPAPLDTVNLMTIAGRDGDIMVAGTTGALWKYSEP